MASNFEGEITHYETRGRKRKYYRSRAATSSETNKAWRASLTVSDKEERKQWKEAKKIEHIAMLDFETDPFDSDKPDDMVMPFTVCIYAEDLPEPIVIWEENFDLFLDQLIDALDDIEEPHTIYAHNGGKFDFMFLVHKLRGKVSFKGRSIMAAKIGKHDLRDSSHILPMKLSEWKKDNFDYKLMTKANRNKHRKEIIEYMVNDCKSLYQIVKAFLIEFGFKLTIGQAAMAELKKSYNVAKLGEQLDETLRTFFYGGRVECLAGAGHFTARPNNRWKLYDVNSMYPYVMAEFQHPIGNHYTFRRRGEITEKTAFLEISCRNYEPGSIGALVTRDGNNETSATVDRGIFRTSIHEFNTAVELGIISDVEILQYVDCDRFTDFSKFILPMYSRRIVTKHKLKEMRKAGVDEDAPELLEVKKEDLFLKFLMNNSYGKFAMNPRRFKESYITAYGEDAPKGFEMCDLPVYRNPELNYAIWEKPSPSKGFNNVGTAASITGGARSVLLRAICGATDPIYCDTDSLICKAVDGVEIDKEKLGAWDLEAEFDEVIIAGKKLYACRDLTKAGTKGEYKIRSKGIPEGRLGWNEMQQILDDQILPIKAFAPTLKRTGEQNYMTRRVSRTAEFNTRGREIIERDIA